MKTAIHRAVFIAGLLSVMSIGLEAKQIRSSQSNRHGAISCGFTGDCWFEVAWRLHQITGGYWCATTPWGSFGKNC